MELYAVWYLFGDWLCCYNWNYNCLKCNCCNWDHLDKFDQRAYSKITIHSEREVFFGKWQINTPYSHYFRDFKANNITAHKQTTNKNMTYRSINSKHAYKPLHTPEDSKIKPTEGGINVCKCPTLGIREIVCVFTRGITNSCSAQMNKTLLTSLLRLRNWQ